MTAPRAVRYEPVPTTLSADLILFVAVSLWALNYAVMKFGVTQISPLAFPVLRFGLGGVARADVPLVILAAVLGISLNQLCFVRRG